MSSCASRTPASDGSILTEHDLQLQEVTQAFHSVEVNASAANEKERTVLDDATRLAVREGERLSKDVGCGRSRAKVERLLRA